MSQGLFAGGTSYEEQSLQDIKEDISGWIDYSSEVLVFFEKTLVQLKETEFYKKKVPFDYLCVINSVPRLCNTNIADLKITLKAIEEDKITDEIVNLFSKVGKRTYDNERENRTEYKSIDDGYWHDYDDSDFRRVESLYTKYANYCCTLFDICNAACRLKDYVNSDISASNIINIDASDNSVSVDNSVKIGDRNTIRNTAIGKDAENSLGKETVFSKVLWKIIIPIIVGIVTAVLLVCLGLE